MSGSFDEMAERAGSRSNGVGIAGFVVSLVGFLGCPLLSPVGIILSVMGLKREPKGLAIAGLVLGILGTLSMIALIVMLAIFGAAGLAAMGGFGNAMAVVETSMDAQMIADAASDYKQQNSKLPATLAELSLPAETTTDHWQQPYGYKLLDDGTGFELLSSGPDTQPGTADDVTITVKGSNFKIKGLKGAEGL